MINNNTITVLMSTVFVLFACSSPQKTYESGDYEKAYKVALRVIEKKGQDDISSLKVLRNSLQQLATKGDYEKTYELALKEFQIGLANQQTRSILAQSMQYFFDDYRIKADSLLQSDSANDWQTVLNVNNKLYQYHLESSPYLDHEFDEALFSVTDEAVIINENLFQYYFDKGQNALQQFENSGLKRYAQNAYYSFIKAKNYNPPQPEEINSLIRSAAAKGTVNYLIESNTRSIRSFSWEIDRMFDDLEGQSTFLNVSYEGIMPNADCSITLNFDDPDIDISDDVDRRRFEEEIVVDYEVEVDTSGNETKTPIHETVEGIVETTTLTKTIRLEVHIDVYSKTRNCDVDDESFYASATTSKSTYKLSGDERAIPSRYKNRSDGEFEDEDDIIEDLLEELYEEVADYIL
jgi:hypothetical protein